MVDSALEQPLDALERRVVRRRPRAAARSGPGRPASTSARRFAAASGRTPASSAAGEPQCRCSVSKRFAKSSGDWCESKADAMGWRAGTKPELVDREEGVRIARPQHVARPSAHLRSGNTVPSGAVNDDSGHTIDSIGLIVSDRKVEVTLVRRVGVGRQPRVGRVEVEQAREARQVGVEREPLHARELLEEGIGASDERRRAATSSACSGKDRAPSTSPCSGGRRAAASSRSGTRRCRTARACDGGDAPTIPQSSGV